MYSLLNSSSQVGQEHNISTALLSNDSNSFEIQFHNSTKNEVKSDSVSLAKNVINISNLVKEMNRNVGNNFSKRTQIIKVRKPHTLKCATQTDNQEQPLKEKKYHFSEKIMILKISGIIFWSIN